jgi:polysaccharide biosynthesis transport protein
MQQTSDTRVTPSLQFQQVLDILYRRGRLIVKGAAVGTLLSALASTMVSTKYTATSLILVGQDRAEGTGPQSAAALGVDDTTIDTHVSMLTTLDHLKRIHDSFIKQPKQSGPDKAGIERTLTIAPVGIDELERRLRVNQERRSRIIALRFTGSNPEQTAAIVNRAAQLYVQELDERSRATSDRSIAWVGDRDPEFKAEIDRARETVQKYRQANNLESDVRVLSLAVPPDRPSSSSRWLFIGLGGLLSAVGTALLAVVIDRLDRRLYTKQQLTQALSIPCAGVVPHTGFIAETRPCDLIVSDPFSAYAEAIRSIVAGTLRLESPAEAPKVILLTSSLRGEGKTTLAVSMAAYAAVLGRRVLLMDLDCRNPSTLRDIDGREDPDVLEHLMGGARIDNAVQHVAAFGFDYLPSPRSASTHGQEGTSLRVNHTASNGAASATGNGSDAGPYWSWTAEPLSVKDPVVLFTDERLKHLLVKLREAYDCVIIDGPPLLMVTEGRLLAAMADKVLFAVEWGATKSEAAQDALAQIVNAATPRFPEAAHVSSVLSKVDPAQYAAISYGVDPKLDRSLRHMVHSAIPVMPRPKENAHGFEPDPKAAFDAAATKG